MNAAPAVGVHKDVLASFMRCVTRWPQHIAIKTQAQSLSYQELRQLASGYARACAGIREPRVLIGLPQIPDAYAAILGTALAGGFHTPLNVSAPDAKLQRIAQLLRPDIVISTGRLGEVLRTTVPSARHVDAARVVTAADPVDTGSRHHLAYIIFTSGSTGLPKGVMVPRSGLANYVGWVSSAFGMGPADRCSQHPNLGFDISMTDIFGALCNGATLCPVNDEGDRLMPARMIAREGITIWNSVPSVVSLMMQARQATARNLSSVRLFNFCGEPLLREHVEALRAAAPDALIQNTYGPTEATIAMTSLLLRSVDTLGVGAASVAIGDPIPNTGMELVGGPSSDEGEIVITGAQLADGYWQDADKTSAAFRPVTAGGQAVRGYYTGDWAQRIDGQIYFKERIDFQVKVRGFRVELDEVSSAIRECGWPVACVVKHGDALAAVVERQDGLALNEAELFKALGQKIERHAIPTRILEIDHMPRNENDKLDRKAAAAWLESRLKLP